MIEAKNLRKVYKTKKGVVVNALDGVSVKLPDTGMVFILGKSGSGKSTLLNVLGGLDSFDSGEIIIKGTSAKDFKQSHYDSYRNTYIGFIFQEYNVLEELTVGANVALAIELQGRRATDEEINSILEEVDLAGFGARKPNELSGGQKQRVAIARALVKKPEIIMADEPTGALDSATGKQVFDTLKKLSQDKLVLIVSHDREFSEQYADRIIELKDGVIISDVEKISSHPISVADSDEEEDDAITYGEGEINLKPGYTLTEEDRLAINKYLSAYAKGATIKVKAKEKKKVAAGEFVDTDESRIVSHKKGDFTLIKSRLSMKNAFKLGSGGLKHKKFRLVFTIFLSLISFTLFGLADTIAAYDNISTATSSIYDTGVDYASFIKEIKQGDDEYSYWTNWNTLLSPEDIETIKNKTGHNVVGVYKKNAQLSFSDSLGKKIPDGMNPNALYSDSFSGITAISESIMNEYGFKLVAGELPAADKNEVLITKYTYDYFSKVGHLGYDKDNVPVESEIKSENDIVGKQIVFDFYYKDSKVYTVSGVVDVNFDYSRYEKLAENDAEHKLSPIELMALQSELEAAQSYSFASICFVNEKMVADISEEAKNNPEEINNAGINYYIVKDDSMDDPWDVHGENGENIIQSEYFNAVYSFDKVKDKVIWFGAPVESLADNQIIVSADMLFNSVRNETPEVWYNIEKLQGKEKTLFESYQNGQLYNFGYYPTLDAHFNYPEYFVAYYWASENTDAAKELIKSVFNYDDEYMNMNYSEDGAIWSSFANMVIEDIFENTDREAENPITQTMIDEYVNRLITTYKLEAYKLSDSEKNLLCYPYVYEGKTYYSTDPNSIFLTIQFSSWQPEILGRRYAAENLSDAIRYNEALKAAQEANRPENSGTPDKPMMPVIPQEKRIEDIVNQYANYIAYNAGFLPGSQSKVEFTPSETAKSYDFYRAEILTKFYKKSTEGKPILSIDAYSNGYRAVVKNVEIVGVFVGSNIVNHNGMYYGYNTVVASENIISNTLGANRGGLYTYAVGKMPTEKTGINELVKFTKTYVNEAGDVKYSLSNNVTSQLDMVDELLEILGQVFLYVGIGFAVFASLMLTNFIGTSISHKKQEIGILRAIGSRSSDVFRIFFAESFIIAMINYVLSVAGTLTVTIVLNNVLRNDAGILITFLNFGIRQVALLLLVSLAVAFVATFFPVKKIASMKPIDAIKNRK